MNQQTTQQDQTTRRATGRTSWRHMTKRQRKNRKRINRLTEYWPDLFSTENPKPVSSGVIHDMLRDAKARDLPMGHGVLRGALTSYLHMTRYLKAIIAGGARYNLKGQPCGEVTPDEKAMSRELLKRRLERKNRKNSQQQVTGDDGSDKRQSGTET
ncbi:TPA: ProQ/FINO family protein [Escherichia coli]